ncbi:MAG: alpha/beta hydrolase [Actinobacteria bacterium]|nr:alpha/beta hydrolase [Actinomycetota bacterium]
MIDLPQRHWGERGPRVLLVHGLSSTAESWWRVGPGIADAGFRVTAVDLRGHGEAPRAERYALVDYAGDLPGDDWFAVIGHSLGGAAAVLAAQRPGFTRALALLDPVLLVTRDEWQATIDDQLSELGLDEQALEALKPHWHERDRAAKLAGIRQTDAHVIEHSFTDNDRWDVTAEATALAVPTLLLRGDPAVYSMLSDETADALAAANPLVDYRVVAGAGHSPHRDRPEETIAALIGWLLADERAGRPGSLG